MGESEGFDGDVEFSNHFASCVKRKNGDQKLDWKTADWLEQILLILELLDDCSGIGQLFFKLLGIEGVPRT